MCVPIQCSSDMLLLVLWRGDGTPPTFWFYVSAEEYLVSSTLLPLPRSVQMRPLWAFPDWECLGPAPVSVDSPAPSQVVPFLEESGFLSFGEYGKLLSSLPVPGGKTRLMLGPCAYADDLFCLRPLVSPLLEEFVEFPLADSHGSAPGVALAPRLFLDFVDLLFLSVEVQLALLPTPLVSDEDEDEDVE